LRVGTINNLGSTPTEVLVPDALGVVNKRTITEFKNDLGLANGINGTIASGQVAFGTAADTIGGDNGLNYDSVNNFLEVGDTNLKSRLSDSGLFISRETAGTFLASITRSSFSNLSAVGFAYVSNLANNAHVFYSENSKIALSIGTIGFGTDPTSDSFVNSYNLRFLNCNGRPNNPLTISSDDSSGSQIGTIINRTNRTAAGNQAIVQFRYNNIETSRFTTSGALLINTTTDAGFRLDVNGTARVQGVLTATADAVVNTVNIGLGGGAIASNTRVGVGALRDNTTGANNVAIGQNSMLSNTTGTFNTAIGRNTLQTSTATTQNVAVGFSALSLATGNSNVGVGLDTLKSTTGSQNVAIGASTLNSNTSGIRNTAVGQSSMNTNTTGGENVSIGRISGSYIADGTTANTISNNSVFIGVNTRALANNQTNQIVIGHTAIGLGSNSVVLGNNLITFTGLKGNVGINTTTNAGFRLDVNGTARVQSSLIVGGSTINANTLFQINGSVSTATLLQMSANSNQNQIAQINNANTGSSAQASYQLSIDAGIASFNAFSAAFGIAEFQSSAVLSSGFMSGGLFLSTGLSAPIRFRINQVEAGRFDSNGNFGVGTNASNNASAKVQINSTTQGFLPPRMTSTQRDAIASPAAGLVIYNTTTNLLNVYNGTMWI
jgi:hypothetical protein